MEHTKLPLSDEIPYKSSSMTRKGAYVALSYMVSSVLLIMFNKAALSSYRFPFTTVMSLSQMACAFVILYVLKSLMIISFTTAESKSSSYNPVMFVPSRTLAQTLPLALPYLLYVVVTMEAVRGINVPMYTTLRRTTIAFTMMMEYFIGGKRHSNIVIISVGVIIFGAFIAGARDLAFDSYGYSIVFIENMCKAVYLTSVSRVVVLCGPILLLWSALRGELQSTLKFPYLLFPGFQALIFLSCAFTFFMNYIVVLNTTINSALTQAICSNLKDVFTSGFGWLLFGGLPYDLFNVLGQSIGFLGSCLYAYCKTRGK
ncbi:nucleotide-sugar uncharacterized transporter 3 isoform X3 [Arachis ipaensis]|uniref:nucleotide-sugar uncharacterized transporter 3 isoform X3 n=1 Tax=Arachis ipaensis TaxID=130454 RepID=UPI0007AF834D|nr:nucleotide-sugar uncharacterized transporter 3 isoform X3 [Arachis ipaensis]XP_025645255.1 UDP-N-acetylglucosamine transporter UGNT1 isoform X3 [Arachis hypogaea]